MSAEMQAGWIKLRGKASKSTRDGGAVSVLRGAPHPNAGLLWARWAISEEGQRAWAQGGETPAHPNVEPLERVRPAAPYMLTIDDIKEFPKYEKLWKEIFQMR